MGSGDRPLVGEVDPTQAWQLLSTSTNTLLVDVRTQAEWSFVGVPDLEGIAQQALFIEWARFPDMSQNPNFLTEVEETLGPDTSGTLLFLCRSGVRSLHAAMAVAGHFPRKGMSPTCLNVTEGFEGDLDASGHRGDQNGWKARGLAWRQS